MVGRKFSTSRNSNKNECNCLYPRENNVNKRHWLVRTLYKFNFRIPGLFWEAARIKYISLWNTLILSGLVSILYIEEIETMLHWNTDRSAPFDAGVKLLRGMLQPVYCIQYPCFTVIGYILVFLCDRMQLKSNSKIWVTR